jgi:zinc D-Ala-D-Ala carboxypeptidase
MFSVEENTRLSKNFILSEFACKDGSKTIIVDYRLVEQLQKLRDTLGKPVVITSGYRTITYNKKCGGIATSLHLKGMAADIKVSGMTPLQVAQAADKLGFLGIGIYPTFTHVDVGGSTSGKKIYWKQNSAGVKTFINKLA